MRTTLQNQNILCCHHSKPKFHANQRYGEAETKSFKESQSERNCNRHYRVIGTQDYVMCFQRKTGRVTASRCSGFQDAELGFRGSPATVGQTPFFSKLIQMVSVPCSQIISRHQKRSKKKHWVSSHYVLHSNFEVFSSPIRDEEKELH